MKSFTVKRFGVTVTVEYPESFTDEQIEQLRRDAEITCTRIRNKRESV